MGVLLTCHDIGKSYGSRELFTGLSLTINEGDRLGLVGPNGSGKSTLLEILAGVKQPDSGTLALRQLTGLGYVPQQSAFPALKTVREVVAESLESSGGAALLDAAAKTGRVEVTLGKVGFAGGEALASTLSGGWQKRLAIAAELVKQPDLLLLDEPTNHLDLEGIVWLEKLLVSAPFASVVISHDRYFLDNVATTMAEISRSYPGGLFFVRSGYEDFLEKKEEFLETQTRRQETLANQVRHELEWLRRGPKARTRKAQARIDAAGRLIQELADVSSRNVSAAADIEFSASERKTKKLIVAKRVEKSLGGRVLFRNANAILSPGTRLGLVGPNGSGKTTLLKLLAGELDPDGGSIERAPALRTVLFDQNREQLDLDASLRRALCPEGDSVIYRGRPVHVAGWAKRFLFGPEQLEMPVGSLSGGERARVLIARLMLEAADILLLDEPTNDLDIPTLETLEESLLEFTGALVLVTHDRYMLDRVSSYVLGLDGEGGATMYADYSQWEQHQAERREESRLMRRAEAERRAPATTGAPARRKLSYLEQREWDQMEARILQAESELQAAQAVMNDPASASDAAALHDAYERARRAQAEVDQLYARWAELEAKIAPGLE